MNTSTFNLSKMNITKKVKNYGDICKIDNVDPIKSIPYPDAKTSEEKAINRFAAAIRITRVLNEGWQPDWNDYSQPKYYPWFDMRASAGSGSGFSYFDCFCVSAHSGVGARLVFKTRALAKFAGNTFTDVYRGFMVIEK